MSTSGVMAAWDVVAAGFAVYETGFTSLISRSATRWPLLLQPTKSMAASKRPTKARIPTRRRKRRAASEATQKLLVLRRSKPIFSVAKTREVNGSAEPGCRRKARRAVIVEDTAKMPCEPVHGGGRKVYR